MLFHYYSITLVIVQLNLRVTSYYLQFLIITTLLIKRILVQWWTARRRCHKCVTGAVLCSARDCRGVRRRFAAFQAGEPSSNPAEDYGFYTAVLPPTPTPTHTLGIAVKTDSSGWCTDPQVVVGCKEKKSSILHCLQYHTGVFKFRRQHGLFVVQFQMNPFTELSYSLILFLG